MISSASFSQVYFLLMMSLLLMSCNIFDSSNKDIAVAKEIVAGKEDVYAGRYTQGFEGSWFTPCLDQNESWKLIDNKDTTFVSQIIKVEENPVYVELKGIPSEKGNFNEFYTVYDREFEVNKVVMVSSRHKHKCP